MPLNISTQDFIEIIQAEDGIILDYLDSTDQNNVVQHYKGSNGNVVMICVSTPVLTNRTAVMHMKELGISELIINLFPRDEQGNH